jgi:hypothetical protein
MVCQVTGSSRRMEATLAYPALPRRPNRVTNGGYGGSCRFLLFDPEAVGQVAQALLQKARLASPYPKCAARIPRAAIRIPCACSCRSRPSAFPDPRSAHTGERELLSCKYDVRRYVRHPSPS